MDEFESYNKLLPLAYQIVGECKPDASAAQKAAFANSAAEIMTGVCGGYGGPSVRQHVAVAVLAGKGLTFEQVIEELLKPDGLIFGPLRPAHFEFWREQSDFCFDDDPRDLHILEANPEEN